MKRLAFALTALLSGCFYPADRGAVLEDKIEKLSVQNKALEQELKESRDKQQATLDDVQKALEQLDKASRRSDADVGVQMQKTVEDVATLHGSFETIQYRLGVLEDAQKKTNDELAKRAEADAAAEKKKEELKRPDDPKEFLKLAETKIKDGDVPLGRALYNEFLKKWPKDGQAGEAHFGLGETYFTEDRCREALYEYNKVIQDFAKSPSAPDAYLHTSECFKKLKMVAESKLALEELVKQHPKSDAAKTAKTKLAELKAGDKPAPKKGGGK
jgi:tol-pal system protein YbgF